MPISTPDLSHTSQEISSELEPLYKLASFPRALGKREENSRQLGEEVGGKIAEASVWFSGNTPTPILKSAVPFNIARGGEGTKFTDRLENNGVSLLLSLNLRQKEAVGLLGWTMASLAGLYRDIAEKFPGSAILTVFDLSVDGGCVADFNNFVAKFARSEERGILSGLADAGITKSIVCFPGFHGGSSFTGAVQRALGNDPLVRKVNVRSFAQELPNGFSDFLMANTTIDRS